MSQPNKLQRINLDSWSASSLLQKAIRRGEVDLARGAATLLHRMRGAAIWRRLINVAVEDIGIADLPLVWDVVRLGTDKQLRALLGSDNELIDDLCTRMAAAPKDRSADYVYCGATKLETALDDRRTFDLLPVDERLSIAKAELEPLVRRAVAALSACAVQKGGRTLVDAEATDRLLAQFHRVPEQLQGVVTALTGRNSHPFGLMLLLIWSHYEFTGGASGCFRVPVPNSEQLQGIPLYTFDKHTSVGKRAISKLPEHSSDLRKVLTQWVPKDRWVDATLMAAFYADAAPVAYRLQWFGSGLLEFVGFNADMTSTGCPMEGAQAVFECVRDNLGLLNALRRSAFPLPLAPLTACSS